MKLKLLSIITIAFTFAHFSSFAQLTTSSISGKVIDPKKEVAIGATVLAIHLPTGTKFGTVTDENGVYNISDMAPGGPYKLTVTYVGYDSQDKDVPNLSLGQNIGPDIILADKATVIQTVVVKAERGPTKTGAGTRIGESQLRTLPTISRSLTDVTKLTPQSSNNSFGGANFRYNNVTIDGTINNDAIGFSPSAGGITGSSGMPGSSTRTNPVSLDAIQDVSVLLVPFDVKVGNVLGGSINAVTRSGSNDVHASAYGFLRTAALTGTDNAGKSGAIGSDYQDYQTGFRVGLPIIKDKLFWFTNEEVTNRTEPLANAAGVLQYDASGNAYPTTITAAQAQQISDTLMKRYGFNPGAFGAVNILSKSTKFFNRFDWNINDNNTLTLRNNTVISSSTNLERDFQNFRFASMNYRQDNDQINTVMELKSRFGNRMSNNLVAGYSTIHDYRTPLANTLPGNSAASNLFPQTEIGNNGGTIIFGNDREGTVFNMHQNTFELTDNFTMYRGKNAFTFGTHNEFYNIQYGFVNSLNGRVSYKSLADFFANNPNRVRGAYPFDPTELPVTPAVRDQIFNNPYAQFNVNMFSLYGQDEYRFSDRLKVTFGLRLDYAQVPNGPLTSAYAQDQTKNTDANYGKTYSYTPLPKITNKLLGDVLPAPRLSFNYDLSGDRSVVLRGGTGIFNGRIPWAWFGYGYYNNGVGYGAYDQNNLAGKKIVGDPLNGAQQFSVNNGATKLTEVDAIDNNFKLPSNLKSDLAIDYNVGGYKFTLEAIYTKVIRDLKFQQINTRDSTSFYAYDVNQQMPIYVGGKINSNFTNAYQLSNTDKGYRYNITLQAAKLYEMGQSGLNITAAYTYGEAKDVTNGIRNSMESNWQLNQSLTPNDPQLAYSNFDIRHRIVATAGLRYAWNSHNNTMLSFVFTSASGTPFTWGLPNTVYNGTGQAAGLIFIPNDADLGKFFTKDITVSGQVITAAQQAANFQNFVNADSYLSTRKGNFTERNGGRTPWNTNLDMRLVHDFNFNVGAAGKTHTIELSFDIFNLTNLLNSSWGYGYYSSNLFNSTASTGVSVTAAPKIAGNYPTYTFSNPTAPYSVDINSSRWQMQLGARYSF